MRTAVLFGMYTLQTVGAGASSVGEDEHQVWRPEPRRPATDTVDPSLWQPVRRGPSGCSRRTRWRHGDDRVYWPQRKTSSHYSCREFSAVFLFIPVCSSCSSWIFTCTELKGHWLCLF